MSKISEISPLFFDFVNEQAEHCFINLRLVVSATCFATKDRLKVDQTPKAVVLLQTGHTITFYGKEADRFHSYIEHLSDLAQFTLEESQKEGVR